MDTHYWDETKMKNDGANPSILAIGDSWFWYPMPGGSLINYLGPLVAKQQHTILAKGMNGAEAFDYVDGKYARQVRETLRLYGAGLSAVFISGGGNDFAGFNDLRPLLKDDCSAEASAKTCFRGGEGGLKSFMDRMDEHYRKLIGAVYTRTRLDCLILMHSYDYAQPNGKGVFKSDAWLLPALLAARVPLALHQDCINLLIDSFHQTLHRITLMDPQHLFVVDSRGALAPGDWANELHPKGSGFKKIAHSAWKPVLQTLQLA
jgi:hypothetical protein